MNRKIRSGIVALIAAIFALAIVIAPSAAWGLEVGDKVYAQNGFEVWIDGRDNPASPRDVDVTVFVDGQQVASDRVSGVAMAGAQLKTVTPDGYDLEVRADGMTASQGVGGNYNLGFGVASDAHSLTVSFAREGRTSGDATVADANTTYGTFFWSKSNAETSAYPRTLTVEVNGQSVYSQTVCTPSILSNGGATSNEYWFQPNQDLYRLDSVELTPADMIDTARRDLTVSLTTRCQCGNDTCLCPGGSDCHCEKSCPCELCNPTLADNQIDTGYGILEYQAPGELESSRDLIVRIFVNGQEEFSTKEPLTIRNLMVGSLNFTPKDGYYYYSTNGYDFHGTGNGSVWNQQDGYLSVVEGDGESVLDIYLWTFQNHTTLDIERRPEVTDDVEGYYVSYDVVDPETGETTTYSYQATSFAAGQTQTIPTNTDITLTAKCRPGYEVTEWSSAETYQGGISLTSPGDEDPSDTVAYGNSVTLRVENAASTRLIVYIEGVKLASDPTPEEVVDLVGDNGVLVDCVNQYANHDDKPFPLTADSIEAERTDNATVEVTVAPESYVSRYDTAVGYEGHKLDPEQQDLTFTLKHDGTGWKVAEGETPVKLTVSCDVAPAPEKPDASDLNDLLDVTVTCTNTSAQHALATYSELLGFSYLIGEPELTTDGYVCNVTLKSTEYVADYNVSVASGHVLAEGEQSEKPVTLAWNGTEWGLAEGQVSTVNFDVVCETPAPDLPDTPEEISKLFEGAPVVVDCVNADVQHSNGEYGILAGSYGWDRSEENPYTAALTVHPTTYVNEYNKTNPDHQLTANSPASQTINFTYDAADKEWKIAQDEPTQFRFEVECDTPVPEQPELPTEGEFDELFPSGLVIVDCGTEGADHGPESFSPIADGGYAFVELTGNVDEGATATMRVYPQAYVGAYEALRSNVPHVLVEGQTYKDVTLTYTKDTGWTVTDFEPIEYIVRCTVCPVDNTPDAPTIPEVNELFVNGAVKVTCVNDKVDHGSETYGLKDGYATVGAVEGNESEGWTVDVTVTPGQYVLDFQTAKGAHHTLQPTSQGAQTITLAYTADGEWALPSADAQFEYMVICADESTDPDDPGTTDPDDPGTTPDNPGDDQGNADDGDNTDDGNKRTDVNGLPKAGDVTTAGLVVAVALGGAAAAGTALAVRKRQH